MLCQAPTGETAPTATAVPGAYTECPCEAVDYAPLSAILGPVFQRCPPRNVGTTIICAPVFGEPGARIPAFVEIQLVGDGGSAADLYTGMRDAQCRPMTDVPGLGQAAYTYTDPATGPHLAAYDGNLYLTMVVLAGASSPGPVPGIEQAMTASARNTMATLRRADNR